MAVRYGRKLVINVYLDDETFDALDLLAKGWGVPRSRIVEQLIKDFLETEQIQQEVERLRQEMRRLRGDDGQEEN